MSLTDAAKRAAARASYRQAPNRINRDQAIALAALLERGELAGVDLPDVDPPAVVALACFGPLDEDNSRTLGVGDDRGRVWQITTAGLTWPVTPGMGPPPA